MGSVRSGARRRPTKLAKTAADPAKVLLTGRQRRQMPTNFPPPAKRWGGTASIAKRCEPGWGDELKVPPPLTPPHRALRARAGGEVFSYCDACPGCRHQASGRKPNSAVRAG